MSYRNKTYVIFDGDNDIWAYRFMKGWKANDKINFDFHDAHDLKPLTDQAGEVTVKRRLRERFSNAKQVIFLMGDSTKNLYRFVRWELQVTLGLDIPIIAVNLNGQRSCDIELCPAIIRDEYVVHVSFKMAIIKYALDNFPPFYHKRDVDAKGPLHYKGEVYKDLGLD